MSKEKTSQNELLLTKLTERLNELGVPVHGRNVTLAKASGYSPSLVSEVMNKKKTCTERFYKLAIAGLSQSEHTAATTQIEQVVKMRSKDERLLAEFRKMTEAEQDEFLKNASIHNLGEGRY